MLASEIELPQSRDRIQPDVVVFRDADSSGPPC